MPIENNPPPMSFGETLGVAQGTSRAALHGEKFAIVGADGKYHTVKIGDKDLTTRGLNFEQQMAIIKVLSDLSRSMDEVRASPNARLLPYEKLDIPNALTRILAYTSDPGQASQAFGVLMTQIMNSTRQMPNARAARAAAAAAPAQPRGAEAQGEMAIPRQGIPNEGNTCWINASLQTLFRNPTLVKAIREEAQKPGADRLFVLIDRIIDKMSRDAPHHEIRQAVIELADHINPGRVQADASLLIDEVLNKLKDKPGFSHSIAFERNRKIPGEPDRYSLEQLNPQEKIAFACQARRNGVIQNLPFTEAINNTDVAKVSRPDVDSSGRAVNAEIEVHQKFTSIPRRIILRSTTNPSFSWNRNEEIALTNDFNNRFTQGVQKVVHEQGKELRYRLVSAICYHPANAAGTSGHYTALEFDHSTRPPRAIHYNDNAQPEEIDNASSDQRVKDLMRSPTYMVWELEDPSLEGTTAEDSRIPGQQPGVQAQQAARAARKAPPAGRERGEIRQRGIEA